MILRSILPQHIGPFSDSGQLSVHREVTVLTGPNDCGKSSVLRVIEVVLNGGAIHENEINRDRIGQFSRPWKEDTDIACLAEFEVAGPTAASADRRDAKADDIVLFKCTLANPGRTITSVQRGGTAVQAGNYRAPRLPSVLRISEATEIHNVINLASPSEAEWRFIRLGFGPQWTLAGYKSFDQLTRSTLVSTAEERFNEQLKLILPSAMRLRFRLIEIGGDPDTLGVTVVDEQRGHTPLGSRGSGVRRLMGLMGSLLPLGQASENTVVLLDEPEMSLHSDAQHTLRRLLEALASNNNIQIIYATHSPAMINPLRPDSVRVIERANRNGKATSRFVNAAYSGTFNLVRSSLGITPSDSLLFAPITIVVEGPTECLCLPHMLRRASTAGAFGSVDLDGVLSQCHLIDGEGSSFTHMCRLALSQNARPVVLLDGDKEAEAEKLRKKYGDVPVILLQSGREFEDLIPPEIYVAAARKVYKLGDGAAYDSYSAWLDDERTSGRLKTAMFSKTVERWLEDRFDVRVHKPTIMDQAIKDAAPTDISTEALSQLVNAILLVSGQI